MEKTKIKIAFLSTYPPRECGIATFTQSIINLFDALYVKNQVKVIAISDKIGKYQYSPRVSFEINQFDRASYIEAAEFVNQSKIEVISLEHEYGIFGGLNGEYILDFMEAVTKPIVLSLHSVLAKHDLHRHALTQRMLDLADSIVVMTNLSKKILLDSFDIDQSKINVIFHGVPNVRFDEKEDAKELLGLNGGKVLSTFGLLGPGKGIELAIESIAKISSRFPNLVYLVIGATHPTIVSQEGESYRYRLIQMVQRLGLQDKIIFINKYLEYEELVDYLMATDIYLSPQKDLNQAVSGTVSYALGCGAAVVSTKTNFATEMLAAGRGVLIDQDPSELAYELDKLLSFDDLLKKTQLAGYSFARSIDFPSVSLKLLKVLESNLLKKSNRWSFRLPDFNELPDLRHLERMTDEIGIVQHANRSRPNYEFGYSVDDQSRALIAIKLMIDKHGKSARLQELFSTYLNFFDKIVDKNETIHNYLDRKGEIADLEAGPSPISRGFWALSIALKCKVLTKNQKNQINRLLSVFKKQLSSDFSHIVAYNLLGYVNLGDKKNIIASADDLVNRFNQTTVSEKDDWRWFDDEMTWANAILPFALVKAYSKVKDEKYLDTAKEALYFLEKSCQSNGVPCPVGQKNWYKRGEEKSLYDQQPIEAADTVWLYNELFRLTKDDKYLQKAKEWMGWYYGNNISDRTIFDKETGGVRDGLMEGGVNENQGAESIVTYLIAHLSFGTRVG